MSGVDIARAWKDDTYRASLTEAQLSSLPENPAGVLALSDYELDEVSGARTEHLLTMGCCGGLTTDPGMCSMFCGYSERCTLPCCGGTELQASDVSAMC